MMTRNNEKAFTKLKDTAEVCQALYSYDPQLDAPLLKFVEDRLKNDDALSVGEMLTRVVNMWVEEEDSTFRMSEHTLANALFIGDTASDTERSEFVEKLEACFGDKGDIELQRCRVSFRSMVDDRLSQSLDVTGLVFSIRFCKGSSSVVLHGMQSSDTYKASSALGRGADSGGSSALRGCAFRISVDCDAADAYFESTRGCLRAVTVQHLRVRPLKAYDAVGQLANAQWTAAQREQWGDGIPMPAVTPLLQVLCDSLAEKVDGSNLAIINMGKGSWMASSLRATWTDVELSDVDCQPANVDSIRSLYSGIMKNISVALGGSIEVFFETHPTISSIMFEACNPSVVQPGTFYSNNVVEPFAVVTGVTTRDAATGSVCMETDVVKFMLNLDLSLHFPIPEDRPEFMGNKTRANRHVFLPLVLFPQWNHHSDSSKHMWIFESLCSRCDIFIASSGAIRQWKGFCSTFESKLQLHPAAAVSSKICVSNAEGWYPRYGRVKMKDVDYHMNHFGVGTMHDICFDVLKKLLEEMCLCYEAKTRIPDKSFEELKVLVESITKKMHISVEHCAAALRCVKEIHRLMSMPTAVSAHIQCGIIRKLYSDRDIKSIRALFNKLPYFLACKNSPYQLTAFDPSTLTHHDDLVTRLDLERAAWFDYSMFPEENTLIRNSSEVIGRRFTESGRIQFALVDFDDTLRKQAPACYTRLFEDERNGIHASDIDLCVIEEIVALYLSGYHLIYSTGRLYSPEIQRRISTAIRGAIKSFFLSIAGSEHSLADYAHNKILCKEIADTSEIVFMRFRPDQNVHEAKRLPLERLIQCARSEHMLCVDSARILDDQWDMVVQTRGKVANMNKRVDSCHDLKTTTTVHWVGTKKFTPKIIVMVNGLQASGKSTLADILVESLNKRTETGLQSSDKKCVLVSSDREALKLAAELGTDSMSGRTDGYSVAKQKFMNHLADSSVATIVIEGVDAGGMFKDVMKRVGTGSYSAVNVYHDIDSVPSGKNATQQFYEKCVVNLLARACTEGDARTTIDYNREHARQILDGIAILPFIYWNPDSKIWKPRPPKNAYVSACQWNMTNMNSPNEENALACAMVAARTSAAIRGKWDLVCDYLNRNDSLFHSNIDIDNNRRLQIFASDPSFMKNKHAAFDILIKFRKFYSSNFSNMVCSYLSHVSKARKSPCWELDGESSLTKLQGKMSINSKESTVVFQNALYDSPDRILQFIDVIRAKVDMLQTGPFVESSLASIGSVVPDQHLAALYIQCPENGTFWTVPRKLESESLCNQLTQNELPHPLHITMMYLQKTELSYFVLAIVDALFSGKVIGYKCAEQGFLVREGETTLVAAGVTVHELVFHDMDLVIRHDTKLQTVLDAMILSRSISPRTIQLVKDSKAYLEQTNPSSLTGLCTDGLSLRPFPWHITTHVSKQVSYDAKKKGIPSFKGPKMANMARDGEVLRMIDSGLYSDESVERLRRVATYTFPLAQDPARTSWGWGTWAPQEK